MHVELASLERKRSFGRFGSFGPSGPFEPKELGVEPREQREVALFLGSRQDEHPAAFRRRKPPIVEIIAVQRDQRSPPLSREAEVLAVTGAAEVVVFDDEEHVPLQPRPHERDEAGRDVGVDVHPRLARQTLGVRA